MQRRHGGDAISTAALRRDAVAPTHGGARRAWYRHLIARPPFVLSPAPVSVGCAGAEKATLQYKCNVARIASGTARGVRASLYLVARRRLQFFGIFLARTNHFGATALNNIHTRETSRQVAAKCGAAPRSLTPKRRGRPHKVAEIGECRGPRNGSLWLIGRLVVVEENGLGIADGRQSSRSLAIMRHGDFNALRSFGFLHLNWCAAASPRCCTPGLTCRWQRCRPAAGPVEIPPIFWLGVPGPPVPHR